LIIIIYVSYRIFYIRLQEKNTVRVAKLEKEKLEEINKDRIDFFTSVSHELKTPLSLIVAPLKYISQNQEMSSESLKRMDVAIKNANKMVELIDELVTFNKVESGNIQ
jgi:signal transduction histidine kinase